MPPDIILTKTDFEQTNWQELIDIVETKECFFYKKVFDRKIEEATEQESEVPEIFMARQRHAIC
ncbi:hypothetical protein [Planococcus lenghuensis]|uniref:Uncharacterized protein n=1 Tax=Planococcus lenghuensis TaxID=2213202 RepID=A0A1Q2L4W3_9BACL|nr:hypothetical protein [Planococcus lenghuensis]AQQ55495.1 hypothetical protein B0X71_20310 [Planococcus lenghuensis]